MMPVAIQLAQEKPFTKITSSNTRNHMDTKNSNSRVTRKPFVKPELKRHSDLPVITAGSIDLQPTHTD